jgi:hypothetical protein
VGRSQEELEASVKQFVISALSDSPLRIVIKVHGFKPKWVKGDSSNSDDSSLVTSVNDTPVKCTGKYNATQFVHTRTVIPRYAVKKGVSIKQENTEADDEKGEIFSMEDRLNSKDFHKTSSIKLTCRDEMPEW